MSTNNKRSPVPTKRARRSSPDSKPMTETKSPFIAVEYSGCRVIILRSTSYTVTLVSIKKAFKKLKYHTNREIQLFVKLDQLDTPVLVVEELWAELVPSLFLVQVITTKLPPIIIESVPEERVSINVMTPSGRWQALHVSLNCAVDRLKAVVREQLLDNLPEDQFKLTYEDDYMIENTTLAQNGVQSGDDIYISCRLKGGKPVIYLFSPSSMSDVRVQLSLVKDWSFSAIYPPTPVASPSNDALGETISWAVDTRPDGSLFDRLNNREVAYLFWEAHTNPKPLVSPPTTPSMELTAFDPARPIILPSNSALLPFDKVTAYIDDALLAMELHTEARTSFITYWLPNLSKHSHIALRFLPQDQYEASAPLRVTPAPEIITRLFMLFMGVRERDLGAWAAAQVPAEEWSRIVGVDRVKAKDASLFRVLEWGGMEIQ